MEVKKLVENLELVNDISSLSLEELEEKYLKDKSTYETFIKNYGDYFNSHLLYQLRVSDQFPKIIEFTKRGNEKYPSLESSEIINSMFDWMEKSKKEFRIGYGDSLEDQIQSTYLLFNEIGVNKSKKSRSYEDVVKGIYEASKKYEGKTDSLHSFMTDLYLKIDSIKTKEDALSFVGDYLNKNPLMEECNDIYYLFFVNYVMFANGQEVDREFLEDCENVIKVGKVLQHMELVSGNFDKDDYERVASKTLKNIDEFKQKRENKEKKARRRIKELFS